MKVVGDDCEIVRSDNVQAKDVDNFTMRDTTVRDGDVQIEEVTGVGLGVAVGHNHIRNANVTACCAPTPTRREKLAEEYGFSDLDDTIPDAHDYLE